jgi:uncharacterized protein (TIGR03083 family)
VIEPVDALEAETERTAGFLDELGPEDWHLPTRCPPLTVRELAVHALRGAYRVVEFLDASPVADEPELDAVSYYRYDAAAEGPTIVRRAQEEARKRAGVALVEEWTEAWRSAVARARAASADNPVVRSPFGTLRLREYLRTRCVEVTIHSMDLRHALGVQPDPTREGLEAACDVLRGLLGTDLRPLGMDDVRFALVGTGRGDLTSGEREMLGPLSDSFPLLQ